MAHARLEAGSRSEQVSISNTQWSQESVKKGVESGKFVKQLFDVRGHRDPATVGLALPVIYQ